MKKIYTLVDAVTGKIGNDLGTIPTHSSVVEGMDADSFCECLLNILLDHKVCGVDFATCDGKNERVEIKTGEDICALRKRLEMGVYKGGIVVDVKEKKELGGTFTTDEILKNLVVPEEVEE